MEDDQREFTTAAATGEDRSEVPDQIAATVAAISSSSGVVLVEGESDKAALETLANRRGRDLAHEGVSIVSMGGATPIRHFLKAVRRASPKARLAGLCDAAEERDFRRALASAGLGVGLDRTGMEALGFYVCVPDLEHELIRSLGAAAVVQVVDDAGESDAFRTFRMQPAWRDEPAEAQLHRFIGTRSGRKIRYGRLLVEALDLTCVPRPLDTVLRKV